MKWSQKANQGSQETHKLVFNKYILRYGLTLTLQLMGYNFKTK